MKIWSSLKTVFKPSFLVINNAQNFRFMISIREDPRTAEYGTFLAEGNPSDLQQGTDSNGQPYVLGHYEAGKYFYIRYGSTVKGVLKYKLIMRDVMEFYDTYVNPDCRGEGIGSILAKAGMEYVVENNLRTRLSCTFMQKFVEDACLPIYFDRVLSS